MASYAQQALALTPDIVTSYGPDFLGYASEFRLWPVAPLASQTLVYENTTLGGRRQQKCYYAQVATEPDITSGVQALLASADILVLAPLVPHYPPSYVRKLLENVPVGCLKVCCPQGYLRSILADNRVVPRDFPEASEILPCFDLLCFSDEDHPRARELALQWRRLASAPEIIMTENASGASIAQPNGTLENIATQPVASELVTDSIGCGDVFAMATSYSYFTNRDLPLAVRYANQAVRAKLLANGQ
jgi:sugar/nucleoside kinase (ribokinase family)